MDTVNHRCPSTSLEGLFSSLNLNSVQARGFYGLRSSLTGILRSSLTGILRSSLTIVVVVLVVVDVIVVVVVVVVVAVVVVVVDVVVVVVDVLVVVVVAVDGVVVVVVAVDLVVEAAFRLQFPNPPFIWSKHICQYKSLHFQFSPNSSSTLIFLIRTIIQFQIILRPSAWSFQNILNSFIPQFLFKSFINFLRLMLWNRISPYQGNILQVIILSLSFEVSQTIQNHFSSSQARVTSQKSLTFVAFPTSHNTFPFIWSFQTIQNHFSSSQARVTSPKSLTFVAFPTHTVFNLNLIHSIFTSWNNDVQSLASWVRLTLVQQIPNIAWISFDLQEHKIHNNASPCYGTFIFALIKLPRIYKIPKPTYFACYGTLNLETNICVCCIYLLQQQEHEKRRSSRYSKELETGQNVELLLEIENLHDSLSPLWIWKEC